MALVLGRLGIAATAKNLASSGVDEFGDLTYSETDSVFECHLRIMSVSETPSGVEETRWKLYASPEVDLAAEDRVSIGGEVYEIVSTYVRTNPRSGLAEAREAEIARAF